MFARGENIGCGTSTTGTGTLTLAAPPAAMGLVDPVTAFGTAGAFPMSYVLTEYTDSTFATVKQFETGNGTLTLASALTSATLARNPIVTGNPSTPAYNATSPTPITIGAAANTVIMQAPTANDLPQGLQGYTTTLGDGLGFLPETIMGVPNITPSPSSGWVWYVPVKIPGGSLIKSMTMYLNTAVTSPTSSSIALALYEVIPMGLTNAGLPGKMTVLSGTLSANPMGAAGAKTITLAAPAYFPGGWYYAAVLTVWAAGSGSPAFSVALARADGPLGTKFGFSGNAVSVAFVTGQTTLTDPATLTSIAGSYGAAGAPALVGVPQMAFRST